MVNALRDQHLIRTKIIRVLRESEGPLSGEVLAAELGMSRVAVWKHIKALNEHGCRITGTARGYILEASPEDSLLPWDIQRMSGTVSHFTETDSTMNRALEAALAGAETGSLFVAERQNAGRGTGGKAWESAAGGLFFTLLLRPNLHPAHYFRAVTAAQCALVETLRDQGISSAAAWPNDILAVNAQTGELSKAGGILCEHLCTGNSIRFLNLGIGMNTGESPDLPGTSRLNITRRQLLEGFLARMETSLTEGSGLEERWAGLCAHTGRRMLYRRGETTDRGDFLGIDRFGNARIRSDKENDEVRCLPGSISILNKGSYS